MRFDDPIELFRAAVDALNHEDWLGAAALCDPGALAEQFRHMREDFWPSGGAPALTPEMLMQGHPDMPREAAEYQVRQLRMVSDGARRLRHNLPTVPDFATLARMTPLEAYAAMLDGQSFRRHLERHLQAGQISEATMARSLARPSYRYIALGAVPDGPSVTHVVYREEEDAIEGDAAWAEDEDGWFASLDPAEQQMARDVAGRSHARTIACRLQPTGGWLLLAGHNFIGMPTAVVLEEEGETRPDAPGGLT